MNSVQVETGLGEVLEFLTEELIALKFVVLMLSGSHFAGICRLCGEMTAVGIVNDGRVQKLYIGNSSEHQRAWTNRQSLAPTITGCPATSTAQRGKEDTYKLVAGR